MLLTEKKQEYICQNISRTDDGELCFAGVPLAALAKKYDVETEVLDAGVESSLSDPQSEAFALVARAVTNTFAHVKVAPYVMTAATDSRFMSALSDNCLRFAPFCVSDAQLQSIHGVNENVDVAALAPAVAFYRYILKGEDA